MSDEQLDLRRSEAKMLDPLEQLEILAHRMTALYDGLLRRIAVEETRIKSANAKTGVTAEVPLIDNVNLCWGKVEDQWRLYLVYDGTESGRQPLANAPRELRMAALDALPRLHDALLLSAQKLVARLETIGA